MNNIKKKLRSRAGASLILAMVFMLFCSFVGGSVLASATANAQRVAQMAEQQDFLLERSAALLASDMFQLDDGKRLRLVIQDSKQDINEMRYIDGGGFEATGRAAYRRVITMQVVTNTTLTEMHKLLLESTVYRYLCDLPADEKYTDLEIHFVDFPEDPDDLSDFLFQVNLESAKNNGGLIEGALNVTATVSNSSGVTIPGYTANFTSGSGLDMFDFYVYFGDNSQVKMTLNAYHGIRDSIEVTNAVEDGTVPGLTDSLPYIQVVENITQHTISWEDPLIEKGGAQ